MPLRFFIAQIPSGGEERPENHPGMVLSDERPAERSGWGADGPRRLARMALFAAGAAIVEMAG